MVYIFATMDIMKKDSNVQIDNSKTLRLAEIRTRQTEPISNFDNGKYL